MKRRYPARKDFHRMANDGGVSDDQDFTTSSPLQEHMRNILSTADMTKLLLVTDNARTTMKMHSTHNRRQPQRHVHRSRSSDSIWCSVASSMDKATLRWAASSDSTWATVSPMHQRMRRPQNDSLRQQRNVGSAAPRQPFRAPENRLSGARPPPGKAQFKPHDNRFQSSQNAKFPQSVNTPPVHPFFPAQTAFTPPGEWNSGIADSNRAFTLADRLPSIAAELSNALRDDNDDGATFAVAPATTTSYGPLREHLPKCVYTQKHPPTVGSTLNTELLQHHSDSIVAIPQRRSSSSFGSSAMEATSSMESDEHNDSDDDCSDVESSGNGSNDWSVCETKSCER